MSPSEYVNQSIKNCIYHLKTKMNGKYSFPKKANNPYKMGCDLPLDIARALYPSEATYYQSLIGILSWMGEIGRIDIATKVSILSSHLAYPREGHMERRGGLEPHHQSVTPVTKKNRNGGDKRCRTT